MTTTPNLALLHVAAAQNQKEVTINDALSGLDSAVCGQLSVDFASGNVTLSAAQYRGSVSFRCANVSVPRDLNLPASVKRLVFVNNADGVAAVTVKLGTGEVEVPDGEGRLLYTDGTANGLFEAGGGGGGSGGGGATTYLVSGSIQARPGASQRVYHHIAGSGFSLKQNLPGSAAVALTAATAQADFDVRVNGVSKGTIRWAAAATVATFIWSADVAVVLGDKIEVIAPASVDATLADITWTLVGSVGNPAGIPVSTYWQSELPIDPSADVQALLAAVSNTAIRTGIAAAPDFVVGLKNKIINGQFRLWQRGKTLSSGSGKRYVADRFFANSSGTTYTSSRQAFTLGQTDVPGEPKWFARVTTTAGGGAGDFCSLAQAIEGVRTLAGKTATLSFYAKADVACSLSCELVQGFGTGGSPSADVNAIGVQKFSLTTTFQRFTKTVTLPSISGKTLGTNDNSWLFVNLWLDGGSTFDGRNGTLGHQSRIFDIADVQLEEGPAATSFEDRPLAVELAMASRYYWKTYGVDVDPGDTSGNGLLTTINPVTQSFAFMGMVPWPTTMRASPTVTGYNPVTGGTANPIRNTTANTDHPINIGVIGDRGAWAIVNSSSITALHALTTHLVADADY